MVNASQYAIGMFYPNFQGKSEYVLGNSISEHYIQGFSDRDYERELKELSALQACIFDDPFSIWESKPAQSMDGANSTLDTVQSSSVTIEKKQKYPEPQVDMKDIYQFMNYADFTGSDSSINEYIDALCTEKGVHYVLCMLNEMYTRYPDNEFLLCSIIDAASHIEYRKLGRFAITLCMGLILVGTPLVWEHVTNACSQWKHPDFIPCLKSIRTESFLLQRLIKRTIHRIDGSEGYKECLFVESQA